MKYISLHLLILNFQDFEQNFTYTTIELMVLAIKYYFEATLADT